MNKSCPRCKLSYPRTTEFFGPHKACGSKDGLSYICRPCRRAEKALYRDKNRERHNAYNNENYHQKRRERGLIPRAELQKRTPEDLKSYYKKWRGGAGREWTRDYTNERRKDPLVRLRHSIGVQMRNALKSGKGRRSWVDLVGYEPEELKTHLEARFEDWMTWGNYGTEWHIDHIRPIVSFSLPDQIRECWALENLRPLSAIENMRKGARAA